MTKKIPFLIIAAMFAVVSMQAQNIIGSFNYDNLRAPNVLCTYGTYHYFDNYSSQYPGPYSSVGIIDYGPNRYGDDNLPASRHTVHTDTASTDSIAKDSLRCIPPGRSTAVRVGCRHGSYFCQAISYTLTVDTTQSDMLAVNFAALYSNVSGQNEPRIMIEILDSTDQRLGYFWIMGHSQDCSFGGLRLNWHTGYLGFIYHDWTAIAFNISQYHSRTIKLRFTTFSCGMGAALHNAYMYYTVDYDFLAMSTLPVVNKSNDITFRAPDGFFKYEWILDSDPTTVFDSVQTTAIPRGADFSCRLTDLFGNTKILRSKSVPRRPHSDFAYSVETPDPNTHILHLTNLAQLYDTTTNTPLPDLEDFHWIIDTNNLCYQHDPVFETTPGWHTISLVTSSGSTGISDTMTRRINLNDENGISTAKTPEIRIYPNPATDRVMVEGCRIHNVSAIDLTGRTIAVPHTASDINISALQKGIYALSITTTDGRTAVRRLVKK